MHNSENTYRVAIVGGGPVGLFLGICLHQLDIPCIVLEKREQIRKGSRSLGIHPVSLELFDKIGLANTFINKGVKIKRGHAFSNKTKLGTLSFNHCPPLYEFILAIPQNKTEAILENHLNTLDPNILKKGARVKRCIQSEQKVEIVYSSGGTHKKLDVNYLVGCDGKHSNVRKQAGISFKGKAYPDTYIMGDFSDNTDYGPDAAIYLCDHGLIESFPLPDNKRRWVVKTDQRISNVAPMDIHQRVSQRIGHDLSNTENFMLSDFGVEKRVAQPMIQNRIILAGDAAHIVSPIGGQGMNLGWLGAWDLAKCLSAILENPQKRGHLLSEFENRRRKAAGNAIRRSEINMSLGRKPQFPIIRNTIVSLMLKKPISYLSSRLFTMRGVERWII